PLLLPASPSSASRHHEAGCPGCALDRRKESSGGRIPYKELFFVGLTTLASSLPITCLFPFMYFMVRDFHVAKTEEDIGSYAGFLASSYMIGRAFSAIFWGIVADRIGRKPVIVFSILVIFNTLFGLSTEYWMAIATRLVLGSLNGLLAPIKVNTAWGFGLVIGPALGGYLAQPAEKYPQIFSKESVFGRFPYFLPCVAVSLLAAIVLISCIWMPETIHKHKSPEKDIQKVKALPSEQSYLDSPRKKSLLQNWPWMSTMVSYCFFGLHDTAYSEALSILIVSTYPFMTYLSGAKLSFALYSAAMMRSVVAITASTGISLLQNHAVRQDQRGTANGISTTAMSFFKAIAPIGAGYLFSWAQKHQDSTFFPGDQMVFLVLNLVQLLGLMFTFEPFLVLPTVGEE
uniref:Major facilitator superfamily (MFS) profile domain-containing protein n=1 Tax=Aegilops tauschii subsp. strangulata TaxID=200361 RepID=A0A453KBG1_AEGTS